MRKHHAERLISAAIVRNGVCHGSARSHADIRRALGNTPPYERAPGDIEGFLTSRNRFVDRDTARSIAIAAGQVAPSFNRELLSSDVRW